MIRCLKHAFLAILAALLLSASTVYASDFLDVNYVNCQRPYVWDSVPSNTFEDSGTSGTYKILLDKENGCLYLAFFIYDQSAAEGADESNARITIDVNSAAFTQKRFDFFNGEQQEQETEFHVITKSSAEFSHMDNAGQNVISGYVYAGLYFEEVDERTVMSITAEYRSGGDSHCIFKDVLLDITSEEDATEEETVVLTETVPHKDGSFVTSGTDKYGASDENKNTEDEKSEDGEKTADATKYTGKAVLGTENSAKASAEGQTKYSAAASGEMSTSLPFSYSQSPGNSVNAAVGTQNSQGLSNSSIALLCAASVLSVGGIGVLAAGIAAHAKNQAVKGDDKNE